MKGMLLKRKSRWYGIKLSNSNSNISENHSTMEPQGKPQPILLLLLSVCSIKATLSAYHFFLIQGILQVKRYDVRKLCYFSIMRVVSVSVEAQKLPRENRNEPQKKVEINKNLQDFSLTNEHKLQVTSIPINPLHHLLYG